MSLRARESGLLNQAEAVKGAVVVVALADNWVSMSLIAAAAWALSCVVDVCFVGNGVYRRASDGPAIAGLFCGIPALMAGIAAQWVGVSVAVMAVAMLSGLAFLLHVHFYFKALFSLNDAVNAEIFNTLGVLLVPLLAFFMLGERLARMNYVAIVVAAAGILLLIRYQVTRMSPRTIGYLLASVAFVSLMMVMQAWALERADYATVVSLFSLSAFAAVLIRFGTRKRERQRINSMCRRFGALFVALQLLELGAVLASQRATDKGPSVSLVALLECSLPVFVMAFSWLFGVLASHYSPARYAALHTALALQTVAAPPKVLSMMMIVFAIVLVQG